MAQQQDSNIVMNTESAKQTKQRSALGIGVTTLVTIMTILLLVAFAVLSLVSARSNLSLSNMAVEQAQMYYLADSEATEWYAELDAFAADLSGAPSSFSAQLTQAGYEAQTTRSGELRVTQGFTITDSRSLVVTISINDDRTTTIRQWQS